MLRLLPVPTADRLPLRAGRGVHPVQAVLPGSPAVTRLPSSPLGPAALPLSPCKALALPLSQRRFLSLSLSANFPLCGCFGVDLKGSVSQPSPAPGSLSPAAQPALRSHGILRWLALAQPASLCGPCTGRSSLPPRPGPGALSPHWSSFCLPALSSMLGVPRLLSQVLPRPYLQV